MLQYLGCARTDRLVDFARIPRFCSLWLKLHASGQLLTLYYGALILQIILSLTRETSAPYSVLRQLRSEFPAILQHQ